MSNYKAIYKEKMKVVGEDMENHINNDVLQGINDDEGLSTQEKQAEQDAIEYVPRGELISYPDLPDQVKILFKKVVNWASNQENHPDEFDPLGYHFSIIFKRGKPIDFSGGFVMNNHDIGTDPMGGDHEWFVSLKNKDEAGMNYIYRIQPKEKNVIDYNTKNQE